MAKSKRTTRSTTRRNQQQLINDSDVVLALAAPPIPPPPPPPSPPILHPSHKVVNGGSSPDKFLILAEDGSSPQPFDSPPSTPDHVLVEDCSDEDAYEDEIIDYSTSGCPTGSPDYPTVTPSSGHNLDAAPDDEGLDYGSAEEAYAGGSKFFTSPVHATPLFPVASASVDRLPTVLSPARPQATAISASTDKDTTLPSIQASFHTSESPTLVIPPAPVTTSPAAHNPIPAPSASTVMESVFDRLGPHEDPPVVVSGGWNIVQSKRIRRKNSPSKHRGRPSIVDHCSAHESSLVHAPLHASAASRGHRLPSQPTPNTNGLAGSRKDKGLVHEPSPMHAPLHAPVHAYQVHHLPTHLAPNTYGTAAGTSRDKEVEGSNKGKEAACPKDLRVRGAEFIIHEEEPPGASTSRTDPSVVSAGIATNRGKRRSSSRGSGGRVLPSSTNI
ncbi:hypothetical protein D5086_027214 [Populus alba]|uniref:Uncharacterized protein n=1 Tax=Populus alba TaxID=43335 RepID=A0ACC4B4M8_POPAL